uniref:V-ATPase 14 kDa subunit n=1 Tax=Anas zonorhyncha TaxID=75864 RepID=A0A8B9UW03_9AVES
MAGRGKLIAVVGDEDTVTGFLLGGVGELNKHRKANFLVDIGIILINQCIAELIRHAVEAHTRSLPAVLEIPSKEHPYDAAKDSVLRRARGMFTADDLR